MALPMTGSPFAAAYFDRATRPSDATPTPSRLPLMKLRLEVLTILFPPFLNGI
jgi:hypothetical protein